KKNVRKRGPGEKLLFIHKTMGCPFKREMTQDIKPMMRSFPGQWDPNMTWVNERVGRSWILMGPLVTRVI
ncbi:hypothetical protein ACR2Y9_26910, partial [Klebsiella pneumoniae]